MNQLDHLVQQAAARAADSLLHPRLWTGAGWTARVGRRGEIVITRGSTEVSHMISDFDLEVLR